MPHDDDRPMPEAFDFSADCRVVGAGPMTMFGPTVRRRLAHPTSTPSPGAGVTSAMSS